MPRSSAKQTLFEGGRRRHVTVTCESTNTRFEVRGSRPPLVARFPSWRRQGKSTIRTRSALSQAFWAMESLLASSKLGPWSASTFFGIFFFIYYFFFFGGGALSVHPSSVRILALASQTVPAVRANSCHGHVRVTRLGPFGSAVACRSRQWLPSDWTAFLSLLLSSADVFSTWNRQHDSPPQVLPVSKRGFGRESHCSVAIASLIPF